MCPPLLLPSHPSLTLCLHTQWVWGGVIFSFGFYFICLALICVSFAWTKLPPKKASLPGTGSSAAAAATAAAAAASNGSADAGEAKLDGKLDGNGADAISSAEKGGSGGGAATLDVVEFTPITLVFR